MTQSYPLMAPVFKKKKFTVSQLFGNDTAFSHWHNVIQLVKLLSKHLIPNVSGTLHDKSSPQIPLSLTGNVAVYVSNILYCKNAVS